MAENQECSSASSCSRESCEGCPSRSGGGPQSFIEELNPFSSVKKVIGIVSGKGGVGKSNTVVNLAVQMQKRGKRVIIFDADFGLANVEIMFGAIPRYNLSDLIYRGKALQEIITPGPMDVGFISGGSGITGVNNLTRDQLRFLVQSLSELDSLADIIIIDTGAGISDSVLEFVTASPEVLLVVTPEPSSMTDAYSLLKAMHRNEEFLQSQTKVKVILKRVVSEEEGKSIFGKLSAVVGQFLQAEIQTTLPGVTIDLEPVPKKMRLERMGQGEYELGLARWGADYSDPVAFLGMWTADSPFNYGNWSDSTYDRMLRAAGTEPLCGDPEARWDLLHQAEEILLEQAAIFPVCEKAVRALVKSDVQGAVFQAVGVNRVWKYAWKGTLDRP